MQPPAAAPQMDPATLAMMRGSDPNGFTSDTSGPLPLPNPLPGNPGSPMAAPTEATGGDRGVSGSPSTNPYTPTGTADQAAQSAQSQLTPWQQYLTERGIGPNSVVDMASHRELLKGFNAMQLKQMELQDPEKVLKLQQMQHDLSTLGMKDQNLQAQTAESQSRVIAGELAKQNAMDAATGQITELQSQRDNLDAIANHPALSSMVGAAGQYNPGITDAQRNLKSYFDQIDGQKLIDGINKIKNESSVPGSPLNFRITQQEALAVKDSVNRLKRSQSPEDYKAAVTSYSSLLDRAIAAKSSQVARMPSVNQELLKQFSYSPASASGTPTAPASAPVIKTIPGHGTFQSLGNGQWKQVQ